MRRVVNPSRNLSARKRARIDEPSTTSGVAIGRKSITLVVARPRNR